MHATPPSPLHSFLTSLRSHTSEGYTLAEVSTAAAMETASTSRKIMPTAGPVPPPPLPPHVHATSAAAAKMVLLPTSVNFAIAMASGVSGWLFVHPADVVKVRCLAFVGPLDLLLSIEPSSSQETFSPLSTLLQVRMQLSGKAGGGMVSTAQNIMKQEGFAGTFLDVFLKRGAARAAIGYFKEYVHSPT